MLPIVSGNMIAQGQGDIYEEKTNKNKGNKKHTKRLSEGHDKGRRSATKGR